MNNDNSNNIIAFDWKFYLDTYPDLRKNGLKDKKGAYLHYMKYGKKEGRAPNATEYIKKSQNLNLNLK